MHALASVFSFLVAALPQQQESAAAVSLFDGRTLAGWHGDPAVWKVEDGCLVGSSGDTPVAANTFLVWTGGEVADFEFTCEVQLTGDNNSGVQYRSQRVGEFGVVGYQADVHPRPEYLGMLYEERGAGILCRSGRFVARDAAGGVRDLGAVAGPRQLDLAQWQSLRIVARGNLLQHEFGGRVTAIVQDDLATAPRRGVLALQVHSGDPMTVRFRNLTLRTLPGEELAVVPPAVEALLARDRLRRQGSAGAVPQWLWDERAAADEELFFRRSFQLAELPSLAQLRATADNRWQVTINGQRVHAGDDWARPRGGNVQHLLRAGENVVGVYASNDGGPAAMALRLEWQIGDTRHELVSDAGWQCSDDDPDGWDAPGFTGAGFQPVTVLGAVGQAGLPWTGAVGEGALGSGGDPFAAQVAVPATELAGPGAADALLVLDVPRSLGSWVVLCADDRGRLYASDQGRGLFRITPARELGGTSTIEAVDVDLDGCQGLCWFRGALYAVVNVRRPGLYRVSDRNGDDQLDHVELLRSLDGSGEHGPHAVLPAPDGENLLVMCGNHTKVPELAASRVRTGWDEDRLLPKIEDPNGHAVGIKAPGGYVCLVSPDGARWELLCCGFRNAYDLALAPDGRLITFDSDMEWDMGLPWYRPTRLLAIVDGADYGWRSGTHKWPTDYPDAPPALCDIGPASPTGVVTHGDHLLALDWTFGTIYALPPGGRRADVFLTGAPFPVADAVSLDGTLYVLTGGRGLPSQLYALRATPPPAAAPPVVADPVLPAEIQRLYEAVRSGGSDAGLVSAALAAVDWSTLPRHARVGWLRVQALALLRGKPLDEAARRELGDLLLARFPSGDERVDAELAELLAFLDAPGFVAKAIPLLSPLRPAPAPDWAEVITRNQNYGGAIARMLAAMPPTGQIAIANALRATRSGWDVPRRRALLEFFVAARAQKGGMSYDGYLKAMGREFWAATPPAEQVGLTELAQQAMAELPKFASTPPRGPGRRWTLDDALAAVGDGEGGDLAAGRNLFHATGCATCHYFAGEGGVYGPDLSSLANKFAVRDVLEAILEPSKVVSDLYAGTVVTRRDGSAVFGRASKKRVDGQEVWEVVPASAAAEPVLVPVADVASTAPSPLSPMPAGLVDGLSATELRDLVRYLRSRGQR